jgi:glucose/arabinose dehydrogenase
VRNGSLEATPFLDISDRVQSGGESGLLGLAFHPSYASNGMLYVNYTHRDGTSRIERYRAGTDPDRADPGTALTILSVQQPAGNHNGGHVEFGPDGLLYIALGDGGGGAGDPNGRGQSRNTLLGKLLRIDVDGGDPYAVPAGNPFQGEAAARAEIWALGLRNPWRFSIDGADGRIYIADVGEMRREEINVARLDAAGLNYGWNIMEGSECFRTTSCTMDGLTRPTVEYTHDAGECSVTGGYVYRGSAIPEMVGYYLYADYCNGWIRSFRMDADTVADHRQWDTDYRGRITSFGKDAQGELYVLTVGSAGAGRLLRIINRE